MTPTQTPTLTGQIDAFQQALAGQVPAAIMVQFAEETARVARSGIAAHALAVGAQAPTFSLPAATGNVVRLVDLLERGPVVLTFYRGEWCPYCNLTLRAYQAALPAITALGATLVAVSPQTPDNSLTTVEKKELTFPVLSDAGNVVARQYGLVVSLSQDVRPLYTAIGSDLPAYNGDQSWELPMAGTFIIARDGTARLAFVDPDYTRQLEPAEIVAALRDLTAGR